MYSYNEEKEKTPMRITLENGVEAKGVYIGLRIDPGNIASWKKMVPDKTL